MTMPVVRLQNHNIYFIFSVVRFVCCQHVRKHLAPFLSKYEESSLGMNTFIISTPPSLYEETSLGMNAFMISTREVWTHS